MHVPYLVKLRKILIKILIEPEVSKIKHILKNTFSVLKWLQDLIPFPNLRTPFRWSYDLHVTFTPLLLLFDGRPWQGDELFTHHLFYENQFTWSVNTFIKWPSKTLQREVSSNHSMNPRPDSPPFFTFTFDQQQRTTTSNNQNSPSCCCILSTIKFSRCVNPGLKSNLLSFLRVVGHRHKVTPVRGD